MKGIPCDNCTTEEACRSAKWCAEALDAAVDFVMHGPDDGPAVVSFDPTLPAEVLAVLRAGRNWRGLYALGLYGGRESSAREALFAALDALPPEYMALLKEAPGNG